MTLLQAIGEYLVKERMKPSRFGREALGDPRFVHDLRNGREPRPETIARVEAYLARAGPVKADPGRALRTALRLHGGAGCGAEITGARDWASATFVGTRLDVAVTLPAGAAAGFVDGLEETELPMKDHFVADIAVTGTRVEGVAAVVTLEALVLEAW